MRSIAIPLQIDKGALTRTEDPKKAIDSALALLMTTPCYSSAADPYYGFVFNNLRFEIFDENEGVVTIPPARAGSSRAGTVFTTRKYPARPITSIPLRLS